MARSWRIGVASANSILLVTFAREQQLACMMAIRLRNLPADATRIPSPRRMTATCDYRRHYVHGDRLSGEELSALAIARRHRRTFVATNRTDKPCFVGLSFCLPCCARARWQARARVFAGTRHEPENPTHHIWHKPPAMNRPRTTHRLPATVPANLSNRTADPGHRRLLALVSAWAFTVSGQHYRRMPRLMSNGRAAAPGFCPVFCPHCPIHASGTSGHHTWAGTTVLSAANHYARASGLHLQRTVDIGIRVKSRRILGRSRPLGSNPDRGQAGGHLSHLRVRIFSVAGEPAIAQVTGRTANK